MIARGEVAAEEGKLLLDLRPWNHEERFRRSVRVPRPLAARDFAVGAGSGAGPVTANVIGVIENHAATRHVTATLEVRDGLVQPDPAQDVLPLALVERHHGTGRVVNGFVQGFGLDAACGVATTGAGHVTKLRNPDHRDYPAAAGPSRAPDPGPTAGSNRRERRSELYGDADTSGAELRSSQSRVVSGMPTTVGIYPIDLYRSR